MNISTSGGKRVLTLPITVLLGMLMLLSACKEQEQSVLSGSMQYATLLSLDESERNGQTSAEDGFIPFTFSVRDPWHEGRTLQQLSVEQPFRRIVMLSSVHASLMNELGRLQVVCGICDADYLCDGAIKRAVQQGSIADCGSSLQPNIERIVSLKPDAIFVSPYENADITKLQHLGVPIVQCADYMESSPLGRAEWVKAYGRMVGARQMTDSLFAAVAERYNALAAKTANAKDGKTNNGKGGGAANLKGKGKTVQVLSDMLLGNVWYQPAAASTIGQFYHDAGAATPFDDMAGQGSLPLSEEQVLQRGSDAEVWLIKQSYDITLQQLGAQNAVYRQFRAFRDGNVWFCNTTQTMYYETVPFHPDLLLENLIMIFHPELGIQPQRAYFQPMKP